MINFYCIYKHGDDRSTDLLSECKESATRFNITVIDFPGVYINIQKTLKEEGLYIDPDGAYKVLSDGVIGCFLSHYSLWKKCIKDNIPVGVLEYDAIFCNPLPDDILSKFSDYCNLDYTRHLYLADEKERYVERIITSSNPEVHEFTGKSSTKSTRFKYINNNHIRGAFGYIITPVGALKLINSAKQNGILPADILINLLYCNMSYTWPSVVKLNKEGFNKKASHTKN